MEKLKDPAMLLSVANSIGLVGSTAYFYKQLEAIRLDMVKMSQTLTAVLRKVAEIEKGEQHKSETVHALGDQIKRLNEQIERLPSFGDFDNIDLDLTEIVDVLMENNISIERPSQASRGRRSGDRRDSRREPSVERRYDRNPRTPMTRSRPDTTRDSDTRAQSARTPRNPRDQRPQTVKQDTRDVSYDDDLDLIGEVRRQAQ